MSKGMSAVMITWLIAFSSHADLPVRAAGSSFHGGDDMGNRCVARPGSSLWASNGMEYGRTATFGKTSDGWLMAVTGMSAMADGLLLVYDGRIPSVRILRGDNLASVRQFGTRGEGPGELAGSPMWGLIPQTAHGLNLSAVTDSLIYIHDSRKVEVFGLDGAHKATIPDPASSPFPGYTTKFLHASGGELFMVNDSLDQRGNRSRRLQTWVVSPEGGRRLATELSLAEPPRVGGSNFTPPRQAAPLWAASSDCFILSDGESEWVVRYDLHTQTADTLLLPSHSVPPPVAAAPPEALQGAIAMRGGGPGTGAGVLPTATMRWSQMIADPDGHLWIRPWQPSEVRAEGEVPVYRINLMTGDAVTDTVPAFPSAFGEPGVFFAIETDPETDEVLVTRYSLHANTIR